MKLFKGLFLIALALLLGEKDIYAQQDAEYSMYMFNGLYLNPAYAGSKDVGHLNALYRHQWVGIDGAPRSGSFSVHSPFKRDQYALGGSIHYDQLGTEKKIKADIDFAFRIPIRDHAKLSFGVRAGVLHYRNNLADADYFQPGTGGPIDATLEDNYSVFIPNMGAGIYLYSKRYYVGVSVPHLLSFSLKNEFELIQTEDVAKQFRHIFATAGVVIGKEYGKVKFKPSILYKYSKNAPMDLDLNASFLVIDRIWLGASYRIGGDIDNIKGESIIGMIEFKATKNLSIGYAYDHTLSRLGQFNSGTHEIMIGFDFGSEAKKYVTPRYIKYF